MPWQKNKSITDFLEKAESFNTQYNAIQLKDKIESLVFSFWSMKKIEDAEKIKEDWDIKENWIPFYGDWHTLFCVDLSSPTPSIIYINDEREIIHRWETIELFVNSLRKIEESKSDTSGIIDEESYLDF